MRGATRVARVACAGGSCAAPHVSRVSHVRVGHARRHTCRTCRICGRGMPHAGIRQGMHASARGSAAPAEQPAAGRHMHMHMQMQMHMQGSAAPAEQPAAGRHTPQRLPRASGKRSARWACAQPAPARAAGVRKVRRETRREERWYPMGRKKSRHPERGKRADSPEV